MASNLAPAREATCRSAAPCRRSGPDRRSRSAAPRGPARPCFVEPHEVLLWPRRRRSDYRTGFFQQSLTLASLLSLAPGLNVGLSNGVYWLPRDCCMDRCHLDPWRFRSLPDRCSSASSTKTDPVESPSRALYRNRVSGTLTRRIALHLGVRWTMGDRAPVRG
jgi:hypothetical protein